MWRLAGLLALTLAASAAASCTLDGLCTLDEDCGGCPGDCGVCPGYSTPVCSDSQHYATFSGACNNLLHTNWGTNGTSMQPMTTVRFADGVSVPFNQPSARMISNRVFDSVSFISNDRHMNLFVTFFGQMINHDCHATDTSSLFGMLSSPTSPLDVWFPGSPTLEVDRMHVTPGTGEGTGRPRRGQVRSVTAFLDGSSVYGSSEGCAQVLRAFTGGLLKEQQYTGGVYPPMSDIPGGDLCHMETPFEGSISLAGDFRANENPALFSVHILFFRNHNFWARRLAGTGEVYTEEQLFQAARAYNRGELQNIAAYEWFPAITGRQLPPYDGYDPTANPAPFPEVLAAALRLGHTMVPEQVNRYRDSKKTVQCCGGPITIEDAFFNTNDLLGTPCAGQCTQDPDIGLDSILAGMLKDPAGEIDPYVVDALRNMLFPFMDRPLDLITLNILRNRDLGVGTLNQVRQGLGLAPHPTFASITSNKHIEFSLKQVYASVNDVELFVGGLSENHLPGGSLGETFTAVLQQFFVNMRRADRFWFENPGSLNSVQCQDEEMRAYIYKTNLWDVINRNTDLHYMNKNSFFQFGFPSTQPPNPYA